MYCHKCGIELDSGSTFCGNCGTAVAVPINENRLVKSPQYTPPAQKQAVNLKKSQNPSGMPMDFDNRNNQDPYMQPQMMNQNPYMQQQQMMTQNPYMQQQMVPPNPYMQQQQMMTQNPYMQQQMMTQNPYMQQQMVSPNPYMQQPPNNVMIINNNNNNNGNGQIKRHNRNKFIAAIIAFFLGGLGAHKFYLGQTGWGIAYLLTCWTGIPAIAAFIEMISYIFTSDEKFDQKFNY